MDPEMSAQESGDQSMSVNSTLADEGQKMSGTLSAKVIEATDREAAYLNEISALRRQLMQTKSDRDHYLTKCQELEAKLAEEESRFYQNQLEGRPTESSVDRVQNLINREEAKDSKIRSLFNLMDKTDTTSQILSQTQETAGNLEKHAKSLSAYQSNIVALYEQLKQTAKFLTDIIHSLGLDDAQVDLLMQKINKLTLDMQESNEVSEQIVNETQQLATELAEMSVLIEESLRVSFINPIQSSFLDNQRNKVSEDLASKNDELASKIDELSQKVEELTHETAELKTHLAVVKEERDQFESQAIASSKAKKDLMEKYGNAMKLVEHRDDELKNRENIIGELQSVASKKIDLPAGLEKEIETQLGKIYSTLSAVTNKLHK